MRKEQLETNKFIDPVDEWKCFVCLKEVQNLELFAEDDERIYLICAPCFERTVQSLPETNLLKDF